MLAMFPMDPLCPEWGIPHTGLTPTGADTGSAERPVRTLGAARWSYKKKSSKQKTGQWMDGLGGELTCL